MGSDVKKYPGLRCPWTRLCVTLASLLEMDAESPVRPPGVVLGVPVGRV